MSRIEKRVVMDDSTERIFSYMLDPGRSGEVWPSLIEAREVRRLSGNMFYARWLYKMTGALFENSEIALVYESDRRAFTRQLTGLSLAITLEFQSDRMTGPCFALDGEYTCWSQC